MASSYSFDVVCQVDLQEVTNAVDQAKREITNRYDFRGSTAEIDLDKIREFQRKTYDLTHAEKEFKPLPPDYNVDDVFKRIDNESLLS